MLVDRVRELAAGQGQSVEAKQQWAVVGDELGRFRRATVHALRGEIRHAPDEPARRCWLQSRHQRLVSPSGRELATAIAATTTSISRTNPPRLPRLSAVDR